MIFFKKIFITIFTIIFFLTNTWLTHASSNLFYLNSDNSLQTKALSKVVLTRENLKTIKNWDKYVKTIDNLIERYLDNQNKLNKLSKKISNARNSLKKLDSKKTDHYNKILDYIDVKIELALIINFWKQEINQLLEEIKNIKLSDKENKEINDRLIDIQLNLFNKLMENFEKVSNYEENGDLKMKLDIDQNNIWKINSYINLNDYTFKSSNFEFQFKWHIEWLINSIPYWQDAMKIELKWFIDFISKDWNLYILLNELNIISKDNINDLEEFIYKLEQIAKKNKYIKFNNPETKEALKILNNLNLKNITKDWKNILSKPFFKAYKKEWNRYLLIPTKYACNQIKKLANKFDPFFWENCSDSQYNSLLKDIKEIWSLYIQLKWNDTIIGFEWKLDNTLINSYINFSNKSINELSLYIIPNQDNYQNEWITFKYKKSNHLKLKIYTDQWNTELNFISQLDSNNRFTNIDYIWNFKWYNNSFTSKLNLKNKTLSWNFKYESNHSKYNYNSWKIKLIPNNIITWKINWTTNYNNKLIDLNLNYSWSNSETNNNYLDGKITYDYPDFSFINNIKWDYIASNLDISWKIDTINNKLKTFDFNLSIKEKPFHSRSIETKEINQLIWIEDANFNEIFNSNITLKNSIISWETFIKENSSKILLIKTNWSYENNYFELNNLFWIYWDLKNNISMMIWNEKIWNIIWNLNIKTDLRNNKNNINIYMDTYFDDKQIIKFEFENISIYNYKKVYIDTPKNIINYEDIK